jgi:beta-glucuronidase
LPGRFRRHDRRPVTQLGGTWDFAFLGGEEPEAVDLTTIRFDDAMAVPGCFDATPRYAGMRGLAAYRTRQFLPEHGRYRLILDGVHHWCRVFVDGEQMRDHVGGFTRFCVDFAGRGGSEVEIVVLVDNRFDYGRCPLHLEYFDWYHYGGITRPVELHRLADPWIEHLTIVTVDVETRRVAVTIDYAATSPPGSTELTITCDGRVVLEETADLDETVGTIERVLDLPGTKLWSPGEPNLHVIHATLGEDDARERIGIRQVRVEGQRLLVNGKPARLLGFNRHEAHPQFGHFQPDALLVSDVQQLRNAGCNFVRGSHYPQDIRFLDLCDEAGILVWQEAIGWQHTAEHLTDEAFIRAQLTNLQEMVAASANRPSVILWGILNESESHEPASRPAYERLLGRLRELDPTRPVTYASNHPYDDSCLDLADVVSINSYPGWYFGGLEDIPDELDRISEHLDSVDQGDKPLIISEIGAGAIPGWRDPHGARWTERYQAELLETVIRHLFVDRDRACGLAIWLYNDFRTTEEVGRVLGRPRGFNDKGVVDEYRRPKLAYETIRRRFLALSDKGN